MKEWERLHGEAEGSRKQIYMCYVANIDPVNQTYNTETVFVNYGY